MTKCILGHFNYQTDCDACNAVMFENLGKYRQELEEINSREEERIHKNSLEDAYGVLGQD